MDAIQISEEKPPSLILAICLVTLGILSEIILIPVFSTLTSDLPIFLEKKELVKSINLITLSLFIKIAAGILQLILLYSWSKALERNIKNTMLVFQLVYENINEDKRGTLSLFLFRLSQMKINSWAFPIYAFLYAFGAIIPVLNVMNIPALIFLAIYLHSLFSVSSDLSKFKNMIYFHLLGGIPFPIPEIRERNVIVVAILSIITLNIYWLYLLIKLTKEISNFINADMKIRKHLTETLK